MLKADDLFQINLHPHVPYLFPQGEDKKMYWPMAGNYSRGIQSPEFNIKGVVKISKQLLLNFHIYLYIIKR